MFLFNKLYNHITFIMTYRRFKKYNHYINIKQYGILLTY